MAGETAGVEDGGLAAEVDGAGVGLGEDGGIGLAGPAHPTAKKVTPNSITVINFLILFNFIVPPFLLN